jgi:hypothetical protein
VKRYCALLRPAAGNTEHIYARLYLNGITEKRVTTHACRFGIDARIQDLLWKLEAQTMPPSDQAQPYGSAYHLKTTE